MTHPLDGARLKVIWAQKHLDILTDKILGYLEDDPRIVSLKQTSNRQWQGEVGIRDTDDKLSMIIGDCLHDLACALDYTMWEIARTYAGRILKPPPIGDDRPYFPLWDNSDSFQNYVRRLNDPKTWNYKIPDPVIAEFEQVQPYQAGYAKLGLFKILINVDKHRVPLVTKGQLDGSLSFRITFANVNPQLAISDAEAKVQTQGTVYVTWQDSFMPREPVQRTMKDFVKLVTDIVPRFDRFVA